MDVVAGIVSYNPDEEKLIKNINAVNYQVDKVVIFDNGSERNLDLKSKLLSTFPNITVLTSNENKGIAYALNRIFDYAKSLSAEYVLTLDQDSVCENNLVKNLKTHFNNVTAICAPAITYRGNKRYSEHGSGVKDVEWVITSASLTSVKAWQSVHGFDETMFIDGVDKEFCFRLRKKGYNILKNYDVHLMHELGSLKCIKLFNRTIYVTHHNPIRNYYMVRNAIYFDRKHYQHSSRAYIAKLLIKTIAFEDKKTKRLLFIGKGIRDGRKMTL